MYHHELRKMEPMNRLYFSNIGDPEEWPSGKSYYFPFAEKLMGYMVGVWIIKAYIWLREF